MEDPKDMEDRKMMRRKTRFGSLEHYEKGGVEVINDDPRNYAFSNIFEAASKSEPYEKVAVAKNLKYVGSGRVFGGRQVGEWHRRRDVGNGWPTQMAHTALSLDLQWTKLSLRRRIGVSHLVFPGQTLRMELSLLRPA